MPIAYASRRKSPNGSREFSLLHPQPEISESRRLLTAKVITYHVALKDHTPLGTGLDRPGEDGVLYSSPSTCWRVRVAWGPKVWQPSLRYPWRYRFYKTFRECDTLWPEIVGISMPSNWSSPSRISTFRYLQRVSAHIQIHCSQSALHQL